MFQLVVIDALNLNIGGILWLNLFIIRNKVIKPIPRLIRLPSDELYFRTIE